VLPSRGNPQASPFPPYFQNIGGPQSVIESPVRQSASLGLGQRLCFDRSRTRYQANCICLAVFQLPLVGFKEQHQPFLSSNECDTEFRRGAVHRATVELVTFVRRSDGPWPHRHSLFFGMCHGRSAQGQEKARRACAFFPLGECEVGIIGIHSGPHRPSVHLVELTLLAAE